ncbi:MAG TPA: hypothetical protein VF615_19425 [Longimicrobiaceae bacterium]|jgi:hypothetical protein
MAEAYLNGSRLALDPGRLIGQGGEAEVYDLGGGRAAKLFFPSDHPGFAHDPAARRAAEERLREHQAKLRAFPRGLPGRVVAPESLLTDRSGRTVTGYVMPLVSGAEVLLRFARRDFRRAGVDNGRVIRVFRDLRATVEATHRAGVVIGDFNDLNVLVRGDEAWLIDADSYQWGGFRSPVFTEKFLDPLLADPAGHRPVPARPYVPDADWYAFAVLLMQSLLFVDPYGGVFRPADPARRLTHPARPLHRVTVFHPEVTYPRSAEPLGVLPDDLLHHFQQTFERDRRGPFPAALLDGLRWTRCTACGGEHARARCPRCAGAAPAAVRDVVRIRGTVRATRVFRTPGVLLRAALQGGRLVHLVHQDGGFRREDGAVVLAGGLHPGMRFRLRGPDTLVGVGRSLAVLRPGRPPEPLEVDPCGGLPTFAAGADHACWIAGGELLRDGPVAPERIGSVLRNRSAVWAGETWGMGFYRTGGATTGFVFDARGRGLDDSVALPAVHGQPTAACCRFAGDRAWLFVATREGGRVVHSCTVVRRDGTVEAALRADGEDAAWLASARGACAAGSALFVPTDEGILRVAVEGGRLVEEARFPDTAHFLDPDCRLLAGPDGIYVVGRREILLLRMG